MLCDAASVREGLLSVLGAGITVVWRESFPAPLFADLAAQFERLDVAASRYDVSISARPVEGGESVFNAELQLQVEARDDDRPQMIPLIVPLRDVGVPGPGSYILEVFVDKVVRGSLRFDAVLMPPAGHEEGNARAVSATPPL